MTPARPVFFVENLPCYSQAKKFFARNVTTSYADAATVHNPVPWLQLAHAAAAPIPADRCRPHLPNMFVLLSSLPRAPISLKSAVPIWCSRNRYATAGWHSNNMYTPVGQCTIALNIPAQTVYSNVTFSTTIK
jgi:hypothetical protein